MAVSKTSDNPSPESFNRLKWGAGTKVAMSAAGRGVSASLILGTLYVVTADVQWHFLQGPAASGAVSAVSLGGVATVVASVTDEMIQAYAYKYVWVSDASTYGDNTNADNAISGITDTGSGNFFYAAVL